MLRMTQSKLWEDVITVACFCTSLICNFSAFLHHSYNSLNSRWGLVGGLCPSTAGHTYYNLWQKMGKL